VPIALDKLLKKCIFMNMQDRLDIKHQGINNFKVGDTPPLPKDPAPPPAPASPATPVTDRERDTGPNGYIPGLHSEEYHMEH
jgi:hypothetical protein